MSKQVFYEIVNRSWRLATSLMVLSLGALLTAHADIYWTVLGTILAPLLTVFGALIRVWYKNHGKLTVQDVDSEFDKATPEEAP